MSFFIAADLDEVVRAEVVAAVEPIRARHDAKWLRPDKLHLTLVFLGHPDATRLLQVESAMREVARRHGAFSLRLHGTGRFATARAPDVLWLGVEGALEPLHAVQAALTVALQMNEERAYRPHVTLARAHGQDALRDAGDALQPLVTKPFVVDHLTLYESANDVYRRVAVTPLVR